MNKNNKAKKKLCLQKNFGGKQGVYFGNGDGFMTLPLDGKGPLLVTVFHNSEKFLFISKKNLNFFDHLLKFLIIIIIKSSF